MEVIEMANETMLEQDSKLFAVPAEIRDYIYTLALTVVPNKDVTVLLSKSRVPIRNRTSSVLDLLLACRQVLSEAEGIFNAIHKLKFGYIQNVGSQKEDRFVVPMLSPARCAAIYHLDLEIWDAEYMVSALEHLQRFPRLRYLTMRFGTRSVNAAQSIDRWGPSTKCIENSLKREVVRILPLIEKLESLFELHLVYDLPKRPSWDDRSILYYLQLTEYHWRQARGNSKDVEREC